jgi:predicted nucleic acid-binding protein
LPRKGRAIAGSPPHGSIFVDSSAWIAFFSARDQHHADADLMFRRAAESGTALLTTNLVLAEIHRLLLCRAGIAAAAAALDRIDASPLVKIEFAGGDNHRAARA